MSEKILVISEGIVIKRDNNFYAKDSWARFLQELLNSNPNIKIGTCTTTDNVDQILKSSYELKIEDKNRIFFIGEYNSYYKYATKYFTRSAINNRIKLKRNVRDSDVVLIRYPSPALNYIYSIKKQQKVIIMIAGSYYDQSDRRFRSKVVSLIYRLIQHIKHYHDKLLIQRADRVLTYNSKYIKMFNLDDSRCFPFKSPLFNKNENIHKPKILDIKKIRIIRICEIIPSKNIELLIELAAKLKAIKFDFEVNLVGSARYSEQYLMQLKNKVREKNLEDNFFFLGWKNREDLYKLYKNSDIHLITSLSEGMPRVYLEACHFGVPTISTPIQGSIDHFKSGAPLLLSKSFSVDDFFETTIGLISDNKAYSKLSKKSIAFSRQWSFEDAINNIQKIINND